MKMNIALHAPMYVHCKRVSATVKLSFRMDILDCTMAWTEEYVKGKLQRKEEAKKSEMLTSQKASSTIHIQAGIKPATLYFIHE